MKKIIFFLMFFLVIGSVTATSKEKIYVGDKIPGMYIRKIDSTGKVTNKQGGFLRRVSDDTFVYCLEPFVSLIDGYEYEEYADEYLSHLNISEDVWEDIVLVAYFGYMYADHTEDYWYYITQMMIWRLVDEKGQFYFTDSLGGNIDEKRYQEEIQEIESLVALHKTLPDIADVIVSYGDELIIEDKNGVLSNYELVRESDLVKLDGNNIIIRGNSLGTHKIDLVRKSKNYATSPLVYIDSKSQKVMAVGNAIDREFSFNITVSGGKIVINKKNSETQEALNIPGIKFLLYDSNNNLIATSYTDEFGKAIFDNLKIGTYYIKEDGEQIIPGFSINEELVEIEIKDRETIDVDFFNDEVLGKIKIIKYQEIFADEIKLELAAGIEFGLYDMDNNLIATSFTNDDGEIIFNNLRVGKYKIKELSKNADYIDNDHFIEIEVKLTMDNNGSEEIVRIDNKLKKGTIEIIKYKELIDKEIVLAKDVEIGLFDKNKNLIKVGKTDSEGKVIFDNIPIGNYYVRELSTFVEYRHDEKYYKVQVKEDMAEKIEIVNYLKKGNLIINKIGDDLLPLEGTEFSVYTLSGELYHSGITNSEGMIEIEDLPLGNYYLQETKASEGYQILKDKIYFNILEDKEEITIKVTNEKISIKIPDTGIYFEEIILFIRKKSLKLI